MANQNRDPSSTQQLGPAFPALASFYQSQIKDLSDIIRNMEIVEDQLKDKHDECQSYLNEISHKRRQNDKFGNLSKGVLNAKNEQIKSKTKNIDAVSTGKCEVMLGIKQIVAKIKVQALSDLPVNKERTLSKLFKTLYDVLYSEKQQFKWQKFNKLALKHQGGQDFVSRLVNINFKELPTQKYDKLMELKTDPQFQKMSTKSEYSKDIIDLADWADYVCLGHQFSVDKKKAERQYDRIRKDVDKKLKGSLQVSENFWKEASQEIDCYQGDLRGVCSQLLAMSFDMRKSLQKISEAPKVPIQSLSEGKTNQIRG